MPRRVWIATAMAALVGAGVALATGGKPGHQSCAAAHSRTLAASKTARIYQLTSGRVFGCSHGRRTLLGSSTGRQRVAMLRLAGDEAGFEAVSMGVDTGSADVRVVDLRSGRTIHTAAAGSPLGRPESFIAVASLVVDGHGGVAWIAQRSAIGLPAASYEVRKFDASGQGLLDSGKAIDPASLRLRGATVSWSDGGALHTSRLA